MDTDVKLSNIGGFKTAASILNGVPPSVESGILEKLDEMDAELSRNNFV